MTEPSDRLPWRPRSSSPIFDGLRRRVVREADLTAHSLAVVCPSLSALGLGFALPWLVGPGAWLSVVAGFGLAWLLALSFGEFGSRLRAAGSLYTYAAKGLGSPVALVVGVSMLLGYAALTSFGLTSASRRTEAGWEAMTGQATSPTFDLVVVGLGIVTCLVIMARGVRWSTRFALGAESVVLTLLVVILVLTTVRHGLPPWSVLSLEGAEPHRLLLGAALIMNITVGFESGATLGIEADRPFRSVPRSMTTTIWLTGSLFLAAVIVSDGARRRGPAYADGPEWRWFSPGAERSTLDGLALLVLAASLIACAVCAWTALTRLLFSFAREGIAWRPLGRTTPRLGVPDVALLVTLPVVAAPAVVSLAIGERPGWMSDHLLESATVVLLVAYGLTALAVIPFLRRLDEITPRVVAIAASAAAGVLVMAVVEIDQDFSEGRYRSVLLLTSVVVVGLVWRARLLRPERVHRVGSHDETQPSDVVLTLSWGPRGVD